MVCVNDEAFAANGRAINALKGKRDFGDHAKYAAHAIEDTAEAKDPNDRKGPLNLKAVDEVSDMVERLYGQDKDAAKAYEKDVLSRLKPKTRAELSNLTKSGFATETPSERKAREDGEKAEKSSPSKKETQNAVADIIDFYHGHKRHYPERFSGGKGEDRLAGGSGNDLLDAYLNDKDGSKPGLDGANGDKNEDGSAISAPKPRKPDSDETESAPHDWAPPLGEGPYSRRQVEMSEAERRKAARHGKSKPTARQQVDSLGFEVVPDNAKGPRTPNQITKSEYDQLVKEAGKEHDWGVGDASLWMSNKLLHGYTGLGSPPSESRLRSFKDQWVKDNANTIKLLARRHGIPADVLAGIASTEVGGDVEVFDDLALLGRTAVRVMPEDMANKLPFAGKRPGDTSAGDVSIQIRHLAKMRGKDPEHLGANERLRLLQDLKSEPYNLDVVARHARDVLEKRYPGFGKHPMTQDQVEWLGYAYNLGHHHSALEPGKDISEISKRNISNYGKDLVKKQSRMRKLLGIK